MIFSPLYFIFVLPALLLGMWAQWRIRSNYNQYSKVRTTTNMTGAQVARRMLDSEGIRDVQIEMAQGMLTDHYDPRSKVLRLSQEVYSVPSVAAAGIAAHEAGHAIQHARSYAPLAIRSALVPATQLGSQLGVWMLLGGFLLEQFAGFGIEIALIGLILFAATAVFALVTLPVEFDASRRAKELLVEHGIMYRDEMVGVNKVLNSAAWTYVAAAMQAIMTVLYYALLIFGGRRD